MGPIGSITTDPSMRMRRKEKLRRVAILCCSFARNLAYYRAGWRRGREIPLYPAEGGFWSQVNGNFLDMCVLEWCKLFADKKGKHHWGNVVTDRAAFKAQLLRHVGLDDEAFQREIDSMRDYRDKFVAHLDEERCGRYPSLDLPKKAVWFYYAHVVNHQAKPGDLAGLQVDLDAGYMDCEDEARTVYASASSPRG
jgi:hypothetical protein